MKKSIMAVAGLVLGACVTARAAYRTEAVVTPGTDAHQYVVQFKIMDVAKDGKGAEGQTPAVICRPR